MTKKDKIKIGIDIRVLSKGSLTGVEEYTIALLKNMLPLEVDQEVEFHLFYGALRKQELDYGWLDQENVVLHQFSLPNRLVMFPLNAFLNWPKLDKMLGGVDVFFSPHFFVNALSDNTKSVLTFHDLSFLKHPEYFTLYKGKIWHALMRIPRQVSRADKIISVSRSTKSDLVDYFDIPESKVEVVHSGIEEKYDEVQDESILKKVRQRYNLPERFILFLGTIEPRKNVENLVRAFNYLKTKEKFDDLALVIAGKKGWKHQQIMQVIGDSSFEDDIIMPGFIEEQDKSALYSLADCFVYPSFFEGFGFPPLEAMQCGTPTVTSNRSSLPEVVGDASIMVDPHRPLVIGEAVEQILSDPSLSERLIKKGKERVKKFDWHQTAKKTLNILTSTVQS